jgi:thioesterase domain-containing protein
MTFEEWAAQEAAKQTSITPTQSPYEFAEAAWNESARQSGHWKELFTAESERAEQLARQAERYREEAASRQRRVTYLEKLPDLVTVRSLLDSLSAPHRRLLDGIAGLQELAEDIEECWKKVSDQPSHR